MVHKIQMSLNIIIEKLGLDWFVLLIGKPAFEDAPSPYPSTLQEVRERFGDLKDIEKLEDATGFCTDLLEREEKRLDKIESKAFTLIGITGIAAGFITGFASIILDQSKITSAGVLKPAVLLYILVAISLMWTIYLAVKVVAVGEYRFTYPSANDIFKLSDSPLHDVKQEHVLSLFYSFAKNQQLINRKATFLNGSQLWFRNSIFLLLILSLLIAGYTLFKPYNQPAGVLSPTVTVAVQQPILPTSTPTLTSTLTRVVQTYTPFNKTQITLQPTPSFTKTFVP